MPDKLETKLSRAWKLRGMTSAFDRCLTCRADVLLGDEIMINVRKLRVLQRKGDAMERQKVVEKTRKYLASVGDRIKTVATKETTRRQLWQYVSEFTGNKMEGEKLERVYHKIKSGKASAAAVHSIGAGTSGAPSIYSSMQNISATCLLT